MWEGLCVGYFLNDGLEGCGVVEGKVGEDFAVDLDAGFVDEAHEFGVAEAVETGGSVDALDPDGSEVVLFVFAVAVGVGETFFPGIFGDGPDVATATEVAAGEFQNFFTTCA